MADVSKDSNTAQRQAIVDELNSLFKQQQVIVKAASIEIQAKRLDLMKQCGELGHVFGPGHFVISASRSCVFCAAGEGWFQQSHEIPNSAGFPSTE